VTEPNNKDIHEWDKADFDAVLGPGVISRLTGYIPREADNAGSADHDAALARLKSAFPNGEVIQQPPPRARRRFIRDADGALRRLTTPHLGTWMRHAAKAGGCTQPIRLYGHHIVANETTGAVIEHFDTADLPDGMRERNRSRRTANFAGSSSALRLVFWLQLSQTSGSLGWCIAGR
jgi:hypothetical protein